jgi:hypothetical protein
VAKAAPPRVAPESFTFSSLRITNTGGQTTSTFRPGQTVVINASYTVRNVRGTAPVTISKTFQTETNGQWKAATNSIETQDTADGTHFYRSTFQINPGLTIPALRIVLGITIGSHTQSKKVIIHISH